jgi:hypothetical protein
MGLFEYINFYYCGKLILLRGWLVYICCEIFLEVF